MRRLNAPLPSPHNAQQLRSFFPGLFSSCTLQMCNNTNFGAGGGWVWSTPQSNFTCIPRNASWLFNCFVHVCLELQTHASRIRVY